MSDQEIAYHELSDSLTEQLIKAIRVAQGGYYE